MNPNFDIIRNDGRLLYEYIRGSHLYGLNTETSDVDTSGIYICTKDELLGFKDYKPQVSDSKHDNTWFEIGELTRLLLKSNPTILESLFIPTDKVIGKINPLMMLFLENKEAFISKECFNPFFGYAKSQIEKARGLNKKITLEQEKKDIVRKSPYDFIYTFHGQGSTKLKNWLENHGLKQEYCGLVKIPNMKDVYGLYYDWGMHIYNHGFVTEELWNGEELFTNNIINYLSLRYKHEVTPREIIDKYKSGIIKPIGYKGIIKEDGTSTELRLSSIENKDDIPLIYISYNEEGYRHHCRQYKEYLEWQKNRNPQRYESNLNQSYDSKNLMHCFRMIHMAKEIAEGQGIILERTWDKEFLLDVRNHKFEYEEIMERLEEEKTLMNEAMEKSTIREKIDRDFVNNLLIAVRKEQLYH